MGEINNITAGPVPLVIDDKTYYLSQLTDKIRAEYERHMEEEALKLVQRQKEALGDDYLELLAKTNQDIIAGVYNFGGRAFHKSATSPSGIIYLFYLLLKPHQKVTLDQVGKLVMRHAEEITLAIRQAIGETEESPKKQEDDVKKKPIPTNSEDCTPP